MGLTSINLNVLKTFQSAVNVSRNVATCVEYLNADISQRQKALSHIFFWFIFPNQDPYVIQMTIYDRECHPVSCNPYACSSVIKMIVPVVCLGDILAQLRWCSWHIDIPWSSFLKYSHVSFLAYNAKEKEKVHKKLRFIRSTVSLCRTPHTIYGY